MKGKIKLIFNKLPKHIILCTIAGLIALSSFNLYTLKVETDSINKLTDIIDSNSEEEKRNYISTVLDMGYKISAQNSELLAKKLETELLKNYDLDKLKNEFDKSILSDDFYSCIKTALSVEDDNNILFDTERNTMLAFKDGIIAEFSNSNKHYIQSKDENILSWDKYINSTSNPKLTESAVKSALHSKNNMAIIQKNGTGGFNDSNVNNLINLFLNEGIDALDDYYFLTISFITEDGDIFGTDDKTFLSNNKNYKLMVINTTNVKEVVSLFEKNLVSIDNRTSQMLTRLDGYNDLRYLGSIAGNVLLFSTALWLITVYNRKIN